MWTGTLVFGLVEIPVRLGPATRPRELSFRQVHARDGGRITFRRACAACGADVPYAEVAKAWQRPDGDLVPLTDGDLAALPLEAARRIEVRCFVAPGTIDPLLVSRSYFLTADDAPSDAPGPDGSAGRAYRLFHTALARSGRVAVATITLRQREARAAVWARGPALVLQTLLTPDELTDPATSPQPADRPADQPFDQSDSELSLAADLIAAMTGEFDLAGHHDRYQDQLEDLARHKFAHTDDPASPTSPISPTNNEDLTSLTNPISPTSNGSTTVTNLTELLRSSLATAR